jgi:hypothetical protein
MISKNHKFLKNEALVICTRNRIIELQKLALILKKCTYLPDEFILVDASDIFKENELLLLFDGLFPKIIISESIASLPFQRNKAISLLSKEIEIVHFIDDDFFPSESYFFHLSFFLKNNSEALGAGGILLPIRNKPKISLFHTIFKLDSNVPGIVLSSGRTSDSQSYVYSSFPYKTQFLSGCSMSFKQSVTTQFNFDENLKGYAQDEDVAFCLQLPPKSLFVIPEATGFHHKSPLNRLNDFEFKKISVQNRYYVMKTYSPSIFKKSHFLLSLIGQLLILLRSPIKNYKLIHGLICGYLEVLNSKFEHD